MPEDDKEHLDDGKGDLGALHQGKVNQDTLPDETSPKRPQSDNERLDEGLEETFPASDPVSAKHIT